LLTKNTYYSWLDTLRLISVLFVFVYHLDSNYLENGYLGVDIFFVISGYIITNILIKDLSIKEFFIRRFKRLLPTLFLLSIVILYFTLKLNQNISLEQIYKEALHSIFFISNYLFYSQSTDYFMQNDLNETAYLHTWSLSIEMQFYLIYPFILKKLINKKLILLYTLFFLAGLSLILSVYSNSYSSFYLFHNRAYEFLFGAITFLCMKEFKLKKIQYNTIIIIFIIFIGIFMSNINPLNNEIAKRLSISLAFCLLIYMCSNSKENFLNNKLTSYFGRASYSIYLIHYPMIIFVGNIIERNFTWYFIIIIFTILLSILSYEFVEKPFRKKIKYSVIYKIFYFLICILFFGLIASIDYKKNDKPIEKIHDNFLKNENDQFCFGVYDKEEFCSFGKSEKKIFIVGDSILESFSKVLVQKLNTRNYEAILMNSSYCYFAPFFDLMDGNKIRDIPNEPCDINYQKKRLDILKKNKGVVILGGQLDFYLSDENNIYFKGQNINFEEEYIKNVNNLIVNGYVILQLPPLPRYEGNLIEEYANLQNINDLEFKIKKNEYLKKIEESLKIFNQLTQKSNKYHFINLTDLFCDQNYCYFTNKNQLTYLDNNHLNTLGAELISNAIIQKIKNLM